MTDQRVVEKLRKLRNPRQTWGLTGYQESDGGAFATAVPDRDGYIYVRMYGDKSDVREVLNLKTGAGQRHNLKVWIELNADGELEVTGVAKSDQYVVNAIAAHYNAPQQIAELRTDVLRNDLLKGLRCRVHEDGGLKIYVEPGLYDYNGTIKWFEGEALDLTTPVDYRPGTANQKLATLITINASNALEVVQAGAAVSIAATAFTYSDYLAIATDYVFDAGLSLSNGQTAFTNGQADILDLRVFNVSMSSILTQAVILSPDSDGRNRVKHTGDFTALEIREATGQSGTTDSFFVANSNGGAKLFRVLQNGGVIINENGADVDTRIEGDTDAFLFVVNAGLDRVTIGNSGGVDNAKAKLDVRGNLLLASTGGAEDISASAIFDVVSTIKGARPAPSLTTTQRDAISSPATGLLIFNVTTGRYEFYDGAAWAAVGGSGGGALPAFGTGTSKTLSSDVCAAGADRHLIISAESGTADTLIEITGLNVGDEVIIRAATSHTITVTHNGGSATDKILLYNGVDYALSGNNTLKLVKTASGKVVQYVNRADANDITYAPASASNWNSSADPGDVDDALDQLASRTKTLESGTPAGGAISTPLPNDSLEIWSAGTSTAPDYWTLSGSGATVARESTTVKHGFYSAALTRSGTDCNLSVDAYSYSGRVYLRGRTLTFGAWVYATVASRARLRVYDGTTTSYSSYHSGGSAWEFLTVTVTVGGSATTLTCGLQVDGGNTTAYIDAAILAEGSSATTYQSRSATIGTHFDPHSKPSSFETTYSDEFDDNTLDAKWTEFDPDAALTVTEDTRGLVFSHASDNTARKWRGIYQAAPANDFTIWAYVALGNVKDTLTNVGLCLWDDATDSTKPLIAVTLGVEASRWTSVWRNTAYNGTNSVPATTVTMPLGYAYLRIRYTHSSTTWFFDSSTNGVLYRQIYTITNGTLSYTPNHFGLICFDVNNLAATTMYHHVGYFRYTNSNVGEGGISGGQRVKHIA